MNIIIEKMLEEDIENLNIEDFDDFWNVNILQEDFNQEHSKYIVAKLDGKIVGFAGINIILDEAHISNIAVRKDKRRLKIGSKLLQNLIGLAENSTSLITLEVNENNLPAINLYEKYGFKNLGKRKKYYNNKFDAYIMTKYFNTYE